MSEEKRSHRVEIILASLALATAVATNWDKIFPKTESTKEYALADTQGSSELMSQPSVVKLPASFDCRKADTNIEKVICNNPSISHADGQLGQLYKRVKNNVSEHSYKSIQDEQRLWLEQRDKKIMNICSSTNGIKVNCVVRLYNQRTYELEEIISK